MEENFLHLLDELKMYESQFELKVNKLEQYDEIVLQEVIDDEQDKKWKCLQIRVSRNLDSYCIKLFTKKGVDPYKFKYEIKIKGVNDFQRIKEGVDDLISGKKGKPHPVRYPL